MKDNAEEFLPVNYPLEAAVNDRVYVLMKLLVFVEFSKKHPYKLGYDVELINPIEQYYDIKVND